MKPRAVCLAPPPPPSLPRGSFSHGSSASVIRSPRRAPPSTPPLPPPARQHVRSGHRPRPFPSGHRSPLARSRAGSITDRPRRSIGSRRVVRSGLRVVVPHQREIVESRQSTRIARAVRDASPTLSLSLGRRRPRRRRRRASVRRSVAIKRLQPNALLMFTVCAEYRENIFFHRPSVQPNSVDISGTSRERRVGDSPDRPTRAREFDVLVLVSRLRLVFVDLADGRNRAFGIVFICPHRRASVRVRRRVIARRIIARRRVVSIASVRARTVSRELALETSSSTSAG